MVYGTTGDYFSAGWAADDRLLVFRATSIGRGALFGIDLGSRTLHPLLGRTQATFNLTAAVRDRKTAVVYLAADLDGEFSSLHALDLSTGQAQNMTPDLPWDVVAAEALHDGCTLGLLVNDDARNTLYLFDLSTRRLRRVNDPPHGFIRTIAAHPTLPILALDVVGLDGISGVWTYDITSDRFEPWTVVTSAETYAEPQVIHYPTFDSVDGVRRMVPAVIVQPRAPGEGNRPVVIDIHGGPTDQSFAMVSPIDPVLFGRATVIRPNVRGSTGYGKTYESLDDGPRREDAVRDIGALLDWIATQAEFDSSRIAVTGGSYGGYMTLATLVHYSDRLRCGIELFGISDFPAFLNESEHGHYPEAQRGEYGDWRDERVRTFLASISPAARADQIRVPLMIYQGANDVRVKPAQSRSMAARIRSGGGRVTYLEVPNEGHSVNQPLTQFYLAVLMSEFMARCLGN